MGTLDLYQKYRFEKPLNCVLKTKNEAEIEEAYEAAAQKVRLLRLLLNFSAWFIFS